MRRAFSFLALLAVVAASAGCGAEDFSPEDVARAAEATLGEKSARTDVRVDLTGFGMEGTLTVKGAGAMRLDRAMWDVTFDLAPVFQQFGAAGVVAETRLIWREERVHLSVPTVLRGEVPGRAKWVGVDLGRAVEARGAGADGLAAMLTLDTSTWIAALKRARTVEEVGDEEVAGVETTHYRGEVRDRDYFAGVPADKRAAARRALEALGSRPDDVSGLDLWVDQDDRIRRMVQTVELPAEAGTPAGKTVVSVTFRDFGVPVDPPQPAKDEVHDLTGDLIEGVAAVDGG